LNANSRKKRTQSRTSTTSAQRSQATAPVSDASAKPPTAPAGLPGRIDELTDAVARLAAASALSDVTETVTSAVRDLLGADGATFVLREDDMCFYVDENAIAPLWKGQRFPAESCVSGWVMAHGEPVMIPDIYLDDRVPHDAYRQTFVRCLAMAPVRAADPIAAIGAYWATRYEPSPREQAILAAIANASASALANLELREQLLRQRTELAAATSDRQTVENAMQGMVHDLRSPMFALDAYATLLASGDVSAEDVPEIAEKMRASVEGMGSRIDRLLALYRLDHQPICPRDTDITQLAETVARHARHLTGAYDVTFRAERGLRATVDPVLGQLMLENLLENAYKYTSRRDDPQVEVRRAHDHAPADTPGMVWIAVEDNGIGFDPARAKELFKAHVRLESASSFAGTGLGLMTVARIVDLHGGHIHADGVPGRGARFCLSLPAA